MFREMRRKRQLLPHEESVAILKKMTNGVLALHGDDGYPYAVPVSYVYADGRISSTAPRKATRQTPSPGTEKCPSAWWNGMKSCPPSSPPISGA